MLRYVRHYDGRSGWALYIDGEPMEFCETLADALEAYYLVLDFERCLGEE